ncbi:MAG: disulfide bond formation protein B [Pseudomonadales bacterium]
MKLPTSRTLFLLVFLGAVTFMGIALYMEHVMNLQPCPMCILQRAMMIAAGLVALVAVIHNPRITGIRVYGGLISLSAIIGATISIRHLWLQSLPADQVPACGPDLEYLLDVFPLTDVIMKILSGDGTCAEVLWSLFGISIPGWALIGFAGFLALGAALIFRPPAPAARG